MVATCCKGMVLQSQDDVWMSSSAPHTESHAYWSCTSERLSAGLALLYWSLHLSAPSQPIAWHLGIMYGIGSR